MDVSFLNLKYVEKNTKVLQYTEIMLTIHFAKCTFSFSYFYSIFGHTAFWAVFINFIMETQVY